jgi:hypothetical protein
MAMISGVKANVEPLKRLDVEKYFAVARLDPHASPCATML